MKYQLERKIFKRSKFDFSVRQQPFSTRIINGVVRTKEDRREIKNASRKDPFSLSEGATIVVQQSKSISRISNYKV